MVLENFYRYEPVMCEAIHTFVEKYNADNDDIDDSEDGKEKVNMYHSSDFVRKKSRDHCNHLLMYIYTHTDLGKHACTMIFFL
jgi:hypothetical protein